LEFSSTGDTQFPGSNSISAPGGLPPAPAYADRSTGLLIFGIIEIIGGVLTLLMIPLLFLGMLISRKAGAAAPAASIVTTSLTYVALAAVLLTLGIGATQAKRWAWALNLILSWIWLIGGVLATIALVFVLPGSFLAGIKQATSQNPSAPPMPTGFMAVLLTFIIVVIAVFAVVLPLVFLLFYRSKNVELTCKDRDKIERWTDRLPLPILAYGLIAGVGCLYCLILAISTPLFPFFGRYLTGVPARGLLLVAAIVDAFVAVSFFRMKVAGWWVAVVAMSLRVLSSLATIGKANLLEAYSHIGRSQKELEILSHNPVFRGSAMLWVTAAITLCYLAFLLWLKRYFRPSASPSYTETPGPLANQIASGN
jgi:hypothetical protein